MGFKIFLIGPLIPVIFSILIHKTTPLLEGPCSSPDTNLFMLIS
jgi:hypothetical protein